MILDNRYEVRQLLYSDTSISLHQGYDRVLNRPVAIEQLQPQLAADPQVVARFLDTARALVMVELPHVAALYDQGEVAGQPFLIFEDPLPATLAAGAPLPAGQVVTLVQQVAETLRVAQGRGGALPVITPETVRYDADGRIQIMQTGLPAQTPVSGVMSSLGLLLLVALTGSPDGRGKTTLPPAFIRVVERTRANQYADPAALVHDLQAAERQATVQTVVVPPPSQALLPNEAPTQMTGAARPPALLQSETSGAAPTTNGPRGLGVGRLALLGLLGLLLVVSLLVFLRRPGTGRATPPATNTIQAVQPSAITTTTTTQAQPTRSNGQPYTVATANGRPLNIRQGPTIASPVIGTAAPGTTVQVFDSPVQADGYTWVHIQTSTADGWCIREALRK